MKFIWSVIRKTAFKSDVIMLSAEIKSNEEWKITAVLPHDVNL
jgi:hypothetical protein